MHLVDGLIREITILRSVVTDLIIAEEADRRDVPTIGYRMDLVGHHAKVAINTLGWTLCHGCSPMKISADNENQLS